MMLSNRFVVVFFIILITCMIMILSYTTSNNYNNETNNNKYGNNQTQQRASNVRYAAQGHFPVNYDPNAKPKYVKNLPKTINPALFAEAEKRLMNCEHIYNKTAGPIFLSKERGDWKLYNQMEWYMMMELIRCEVPFTFTRQSDGEFSIMNGVAIGNHTQASILDKWSYDGGIGKLSRALQDSLDNLPLNNGIVIHGYVCTDTWRTMHNYQVNASQQNTRFISATYVFAGCNFWLTTKFMNEIVLQRKLNQPVMLIVNKECQKREHLLLQWALEVFYLPDDFPKYWEEHGEVLLATFSSIARSYTGVLFLVSGGPGAAPIQLAMSRANPWNQYISMGSALETWAKGYHSRGAITSFDPQCYLKEDAQCIFRKHPVTGQSETWEEYLEASKSLHMDEANILGN